MMMRWQRFLLAALMAVAATGCADIGSSSGPANQRYPVKLRLTLDGQPMESGEVQLLPSYGRAMAIGPVKDGVAELEAVTGVSRVEVRQMKSVPGEREPVNVLPARFNFQSDLKIEVVAGGENEFSFDLKSQ